jgi:hypothetical protein
MVACSQAVRRQAGSQLCNAKQIIRVETKAGLLKRVECGYGNEYGKRALGRSSYIYIYIYIYIWKNNTYLGNRLGELGQVKVSVRKC